MDSSELFRWKLNELRDAHKGKMAILVGKGPSLEQLHKCEWIFQPNRGPVICIKQSIQKADELHVQPPLYVVQQDHAALAGCVPQSAGTKHFLNYNGSWNVPEWAPNALLYSPSWFGETTSTLTAVIALHIAKLMGCTGVGFVAFDAMQPGGSCEYAPSMGPQNPRAGGIGRHRPHGTHILAEAKKLGLATSVHVAL